MADEKDFVYGVYVTKRRDNDAVKIAGEDQKLDDGTWYNVQQKIQGFLQNFRKGDKVRFKVDVKEKRKVIYLLYKVEGEGGKTEQSDPTPKEKKEPKPKTTTGRDDGKPDQAYWDKRTKSIIRQSYVRSAAIAIPVLGNVENTETLVQMIITIAEGFMDWENKKAKDD